MIDTDSPSGSYAKAIARSDKRNQRNADIVAKNITIKRMARAGSSLAEITTETGMGPDYIKRIAGELLQ